MALITSLALNSTHPDELPFDPHIKQGEPKYCIGDEKTLAAMYFMGCNLCFPSTIYKTDVYKKNIFDWEPYKKLGDRPSTLYYASFGKAIILLENYMYYRIHSGQDLIQTHNSLHFSELCNYYSLFKKTLYGSGRLYKNIWKYYSKNFTKLVAKANGYTIKEFKNFYKKNIFYPDWLFKKRKSFWTSRFEKLFFPNMTLSDIFSINNEQYVRSGNNENKSIQTNTGKNANGKQLFSIKSVFNKKGEAQTVLYFLGIKIRLKKNNRLIKHIHGSDNVIRIKNSFIHGRLEIIIHGKNNAVNFENVDFQGSGKIVISGNNHIVEITNEWIGKNLSVFINPPSVNRSLSPCIIKIDGGTIEDLNIINPHGGTGVIIGRNHMISAGVSIQNTDSHPIYDADSNRLLNKPSKNVIIGTNCWIGMNVTILKEVVLAPGTIVGYGAVVTKSHQEKNCIIAGVPAKIVKQNILWKQKDENFF